MQTEVIIAGFGGQGVLFAGQLLAYAALGSGLETTWIPSYGPEMRGGTANCTVVISDEEIGSPFVRNPAALIDRLRRTIAAGASKFVLIPLARGTREVFAQLDRLAAEVIPVVEAPGFAGD